MTPTTWAGLSNCQRTDRRICRQVDGSTGDKAGGQGRAAVVTKSIN